MNFAEFFNTTFDPELTEESKEQIEKDFGKDTISYTEARDILMQILSDLTVTIGGYNLATATKLEYTIDALHNNGHLTSEELEKLKNKFKDIDSIMEGNYNE